MANKKLIAKKYLFSFGKNWKNYLKSLNKEKIIYAKESLKKFLGDVRHKTFLDIGCGSGLFSYSIYLLGAKKIVSFDLDTFSIECTKYLWSKVKNPEKWKIYQGSILDKIFISKLKKFDIVYSWGALHHTGKMWEAINNAVSLVNDGGFIYIAIYNKTRYSKNWLKVKEIYNTTPDWTKFIISLLYFFIFSFSLSLVRLKNPFKIIKNYKKSQRGMNLFEDINDWLGGYPFEYATFNEIVKFFDNLDSKFELIKYVKQTKSFGNNEFLYKKITKSD